MRSRQSAALLAVALLAATAGCGFITGQESLSFSASPATVSDDARSETGYEEVNVTAETVSREFSVADQTRTVEVTNQLAQYERRVGLAALGTRRAALFVAFASPQVEIATESFNPIAELSEREILARFDSQYGGVSVGERVDNRTATVLGQSTAVEQFAGTATLAGSDIDVYVHATKVKHEGDFVVAIAVYPQRLDGEAERVATLLQGLEH